VDRLRMPEDQIENFDAHLSLSLKSQWHGENIARRRCVDKDPVLAPQGRGLTIVLNAVPSHVHTRPGIGLGCKGFVRWVLPAQPLRKGQLKSSNRTSLLKLTYTVGRHSSAPSSSCAIRSHAVL
jgi:hypothetical protein